MSHLNDTQQTKIELAGQQKYYTNMKGKSHCTEHLIAGK